MIVVPDRRPRELESSLNREVAEPVGDDDVSSFGEGGDDGRDGGEVLSVEDGGRDLEERGDVGFEGGVDVCERKSRKEKVSERVAAAREEEKKNEKNRRTDRSQKPWC